MFMLLLCRANAAAYDAGACSKDQWYPVDVVPCGMTVVDYVRDASGILAQKTFTCTLPNCETLGWDKINQSFDVRQYECTEN
jgi:hypothetical protein